MKKQAYLLTPIDADGLNINDSFNTSQNSKEIELQLDDQGESILTNVTEPVNIRVDNHIRNKIAALIALGYGSTQKEMVDKLLDTFIDTIDSDGVKKRFNDLLEIYEEKDVKNYYRKSNKKK